MPPTYHAVTESIALPSSELAASLDLPQPKPGGPRLVIGRAEWLALPEFGVCSLNAKTDSGARSSSLHAEDIVLSDDRRTVRFTTYGHHNKAIQCEAPVARFGRVRSSTGIARKRVFIETTAILCGGFRWKVLVSLANRSDMLCPFLLGRRAMAGYFLVDPIGNHMLGPRRQLEREFHAAYPDIAI